MKHARDERTQNLAERLCWQVARRDDTRIARRLYRKQVGDGVYGLDEEAVLDAFFHSSGRASAPRGRCAQIPWPRIA